MDRYSPHDSAISIASSSKPRSPRSSNSPPQDTTLSGPPPPSNPSYSAFAALPTEAQNLESHAAAQEAQSQIVADSPAPDDVSDAGYETDSGGSVSTSLSSSVRDYLFENGRRYHRFREGQYNFPNDDSEQDREDMKHAMVVNLCQTLHFAPIGQYPGNVLDMGTGTGIWAIQMGDEYPMASILGVDLSPIQPVWVPPNVQFMVDDVESPWLKPENYFNYVHARNTVMAIKDWPQLMRRVYEHLAPGGWFELQEIHHRPQCHDGTMPLNYAVAEYWTLITDALAALGVNFDATLLLADIMRDAGFTNISTRIFHIPIGTWPKNRVLKQVGLYWRTILIDGLSPIALGPLTRGLGWTREQVEAWLVVVRKSYMEGDVHSHMPLHIICGQKPAY